MSSCNQLLLQQLLIIKLRKITSEGVRKEICIEHHKNCKYCPQSLFNTTPQNPHKDNLRTQIGPKKVFLAKNNKQKTFSKSPQQMLTIFEIQTVLREDIQTKKLFNSQILPVGMGMHFTPEYLWLLEVQRPSGHRLLVGMLASIALEIGEIHFLRNTEMQLKNMTKQTE